MMARRWAAHVALLFVLLRVLVPPGYMPDLGALRGGQFQVVLCSTDGQRTITLDASGNPVPGNTTDHPAKAGALHCPFGLAAPADVILPTLPALPLPRIAAAAQSGTAFVIGVRPPVRGPPLGPRGPPTDLV